MTWPVRLDWCDSSSAGVQCTLLWFAMVTWLWAKICRNTCRTHRAESWRAVRQTALPSTWQEKVSERPISALMVNRNMKHEFTQKKQISCAHKFMQINMRVRVCVPSLSVCVFAGECSCGAYYVFVNVRFCAGLFCFEARMVTCRCDSAMYMPVTHINGWFWIRVQRLKRWWTLVKQGKR